MNKELHELRDKLKALQTRINTIEQKDGISMASQQPEPENEAYRTAMNFFACLTEEVITILYYNE